VCELVPPHTEMNPLIVPVHRPRPPTTTCVICAYDINNPGALRQNGTGQTITNIQHHLAHDPGHARRVTQGRGALAVANGFHVLWMHNQPQFDVVHRCLACALDPQGVPRHKFGNMEPLNVAQHLGSPDHVRRAMDPRMRLYAQAHANHPGQFQGEAW
jgi:hypothetical protein